MAKLPTKEELDEIRNSAEAAKKSKETDGWAEERKRQEAEAKIYASEHARVVEMVLDRLPELMRAAAAGGGTDGNHTAAAVLRFDRTSYAERYKNESENILKVLQCRIDTPGYRVGWVDNGKITRGASEQFIWFGDYDAPRAADLTRGSHEAPKVFMTSLRVFVPSDLLETKQASAALKAATESFGPPIESTSAIIVAHGGIFSAKKI